MEDKINILVIDTIVKDRVSTAELINNPDLNIVECDINDKPLNYFVDDRFALILIDVGAPPDYCGFKVAKQLIKRSVSCEIPIVLITDQYEDEAHVLKGYEAGAVDYLFKPINPVILRKKTEFLLKIYKQKKEDDKARSELKANLIKTQNSKENIESKNIELKHLSRIDNLTGLFNQRHMADVTHVEFERAMRYNKDLSCLMLDLDYFKNVNDLCGHQFGDFVLKELAKSIKNHIREVDFAFRYGGEEFLILLPQTDIEGAYLTAEKLRQFCQDYVYDNSQNITMVTISVGVASVISNIPKSPDELIHYADKALYDAKTEGRNLVRLYKPAEEDDLLSDENVIHLRDKIEKILKRTKSAAISSIEMLVRETGGGVMASHNQKVLGFIDLVGDKMRMPKTIIAPFKRAAILHDCFKYLLGQSMNINEQLSSEDRAIVESYPYMLAELTELFDFFANERSVLLFHHENYDGTGYPEGLKGSEIPLGARIFSIADAVVAMLSERPYRSGKNLEEVSYELRKNSGKQFDPNIVDIFISILEAKKGEE